MSGLRRASRRNPIAAEKNPRAWSSEIVSLTTNVEVKKAMPGRTARKAFSCHRSPGMIRAM